MNPVEFKEQTKILAKPDSMTDDECESLPIWNDGNHCISCWRPSWRERLSILLFGRVWLWVFSGDTQPPVAIDGCKELFKSEGEK